MEQLQLKLTHPRQINIDGHVDEKTNIKYFGKATQQFDGTWIALADVCGCFCLVEVKIK